MEPFADAMPLLEGMARPQLFLLGTSSIDVPSAVPQFASSYGAGSDQRC